MSHTQNDVLSLAKTVKKNNTNIFKALKAKGIGVESYDSSTFADAVNSWTPTFTVPNGMKFDNSSIESFPDSFDFSEVTDFQSLFENCYAMITAPNANYIGLLWRTFFSCYNMTSIPDIDWSNVSDLTMTFFNCKNLTGSLSISIPNCTTINGCFEETGFTSIDLNSSTAGLTNAMQAFDLCPNLESVLNIDFTSISDSGRLPTFIIEGSGTENNTVLTTLTLSGSLNVSWDRTKCIALNFDSIKSILTAASNTSNSDVKTLNFNLTVTDDSESTLQNLKTTCEGLGWLINGLTIEEYVEE